MMRWSCQRLHGCVPVDERATPYASARAPSCARRCAMRSAASANESQRPVLTSISDAISSPTRCSSSSVPAAAAWSSSKRLVSSNVSGSSSANSSSTATVRSSAFSKDSCANAICSSGVSRCVSPIALSYLKRFQQPLCDSSPAPALDCCATCGFAKPSTLLLRQREQRVQLAREVALVAVFEARELAVLGRVRRLEALGDLGQAGVARDERRAAGGGCFGRDHAERLREDRRHDGGLREREQVDEMAVLERAGEQRPGRRESLELLAIVAEADDHGARVHLAQRGEQDVDALVVQQLSEVEDGREVFLEEGGEPLGVSLVGETLVRVVRVRRVDCGFREQRTERVVARLETELVDVDAGWDLVHALDVADDVVEHCADVRGADEDRLCAAER